MFLSKLEPKIVGGPLSSCFLLEFLRLLIFGIYVFVKYENVARITSDLEYKKKVLNDRAKGSAVQLPCPVG